MPDYSRPLKYRAIIKGLRALGLVISEGSRHTLATCPKTNRKTTIPRHPGDINKFVVKSICDFLEDIGHSEQDILRAMKLN